jgi:hypothetical protein
VFILSVVIGIGFLVLGTVWMVLDFIDKEFWGGASYFLAGLSGFVLIAFWREVAKGEFIGRYVVSRLCALLGILAVFREHPGFNMCLVEANAELAGVATSMMRMPVRHAARADGDELRMLIRCSTQPQFNLSDAASSLFKALYLEPEYSIIERLGGKPQPPHDDCADAYRALRDNILSIRPGIEEKFPCLKRITAEPSLPQKQ